YFILPARLVRQSQEVEDVVSKNLSLEEAISLYPDLDIFSDMIEKMKKEHITSREYIADVCRNILRNVAVFKEDKKGQEAFIEFVKGALL
ncbi:MAG TPA: hypothetical protein DEF61_05040, partial [Firmicutes bacterium]|nr:hypothetical protein [Bacillota bacterium]